LGASIILSFAFGFSAPAVTVQDGLDREISLAEPAERIVATLPSTTEMVLRLGLAEKVVGVTSLIDYLAYVPEIQSIAQETEKIGGFEISTEKIASLNPDLVVVGASAQKDLLSRLKKLETEVYAVGSEGVADITEALLELGYLCGVLEEAQEIVGEMEFSRLRLQEAVSGLESRKRTLYIISKAIYTTGENTFQGKLLKMAGLRNVFSDISGFKKVSDEVIVERNPELILSGPHGTVGLTVEDLEERPGFDEIEAVREGEIVFLSKEENSMISQPGTRVIQGAIAVFEKVYGKEL